MTTMYDAPMQDFTGDTSMDADMLPSMSTEADWLQAESMMDDGDFVRPEEDEVEMANEEVQEFEMTDAEVAEISEYQETSPDFIETQDQELPDASRAVSPVVLLYQDHEQVPTIAPLDYSDEMGTAASTASESTSHEQSIHPSSSTIHQKDNIIKETNPPGGESTHIETLIKTPEENLGLGDVPNPDVSVTTIVHSPKEVVDVSSHDAVFTPPHEGSGVSSSISLSHDPPDFKLEKIEPGTTMHDNSGTSKKIGTVETTQSHDNVESYHAVETGLGEIQEQAENNEAVREYSGDNDENIDPTQNEEEVGSSVDQPPCILLSFAFDGTNYALFELPAENNLTTESLDAADELHPSHQSDHRDEKPQEPTMVTSRSKPVLLFQDRSDLFYEPISSVFGLLRADETTNVEGRFDQNIELVLSAPDLDLTLPEDNIHAREVSLHELTILHTGCDLPGYLSLRLDTNAPRFGTRYKAIRDEVLRVISQEAADPQDTLAPTAETFHNKTEGKHTNNFMGTSGIPESGPGSAEHDESETKQANVEGLGDINHQEQEHGGEDARDVIAAPGDYEGQSTDEVVETSHTGSVQVQENRGGNDAEEYYDDDNTDAEHINAEGSLEIGYERTGTADAEGEADYQDAEGVQEDEYYFEQETIYDEQQEDESRSDQLSEESQGRFTGDQEEEEFSSEIDNSAFAKVADNAPLMQHYHQETTNIIPTAHGSTFPLPESSEDKLLPQEKDKTLITSTVRKSPSVSPMGRSDVASNESRLRSKGPKRSFDEHEADQDQDIGITNDTGDIKRLKVE